MGPAEGKFRIAILVSGRGSNMEAVLRAVRDGKLPGVEVSLVLSDNPDAKALEIARGYGAVAEYLHPGDFKTKLEGPAEENYIRRIKESEADLVVLAGFMRIIKIGFIRSFQNRIINIHPSLLPNYPGLHTHARAIEAGDREAGCTVHFVNEVTDGGKRILRAKVPVHKDDTPEKLAERVLEKEHVILPMAIGLIAGGKIEYDQMPDDPVTL